MITSEALDAELFADFERRAVEVDGQRLLVLVGGGGPGVLFVHGDPQTHLCWYRIAPRLTDRFTVVVPDLRGRGESHKPRPSATSEAYSKRAMAAELLGVMRHLGFDRFDVVGHDRGARVARRMALDHADAVRRLCVMDIVPALDLYEQTTPQLAQDYFYFFFLTQPAPLPERLIAGDPEAFQKQILCGLGDAADLYRADVLAHYTEASATPEAIAAMCECFRAGFGIDRIHDRADREVGRTITCPTLVMWGERGVIGRHFDMRAVWDRWCRDSRYTQMPSGHFIPEHAATEAFAAIDNFLHEDRP